MGDDSEQNLIALVSALSKKFDEQKETLATFATKVDIEKLLDEKLNVCTTRIAACEEKCEILESMMKEQEDISTRVKNLLVTGIPFKTNENLQEIMRIISSKCGFEHPPESNVFRFAGADPNKRPIVIKFATEFHKMQFIHAYYRVAKNLLLDLFPGFADAHNRIYISHDFSTTQYRFNKHALAMKKEGKVNQVRVMEGNRLEVKVKPDGRFKRYHSIDDLNNEINK